MIKPLVSVIIPTKNSSTTLGACLESVKTQRYSPVEVIVVDNYSNDKTLDLAHRHTSLLFSKGPERSAQRNFGVKKASGEYIVIIDSDMVLAPSVISDCVKLIESQPGLEGVVIPEESFGEGYWAQCKKLERSFYVGVDYMEAARFFKRDTFLSVGGYDTKMVSGEDWDLSQRIEEVGPLGRVSSYIYHNEGKISLLKTIKKKFYYAQKFATYREKGGHSEKIKQQTGLLGRYRLFLSRPRLLFRNPVLGLGMLFMKTCEFAFGGLGYLQVLIHKRVRQSEK